MGDLERLSPLTGGKWRGALYDEVGLERCVQVGSIFNAESSVESMTGSNHIVNRRAGQVLTPRLSSATGMKVHHPQSLQSETVEVVQFTSEAGLSPASIQHGQFLPGDESGTNLQVSMMISSTSEETETLTKFSHRFVWLVALLMLQSLSSFILKRFEDVFLEHSIVVLFLTMLVGAGGNAGSQSTVLAIRGIAKGSFAPHASVLEFIMHEIATGFKLAVILACVSFVRVWLFDGNIWEVTAICVSMFGIVFIAVLIGTLMPLSLWYFGFDAAHAGAAIQVTIDIVGVTMTCVISSLVFGFLSQAFTPTMQLPHKQQQQSWEVLGR